MNSQKDDLIATFNTSKGRFKCILFKDLVPRTVSNFYNLVHKRFYNGLTFHRVEAGFVIQSGCPQGNGFGGPGYKFKDEFHSKLKHERPGVLSMANGGANSNGSQYFFTLSANPHLDGRHSVFGEVIDGYDKILNISYVEVDKNKKPLIDIIINSITITGKFKPVKIGKVGLGGLFGF